MLTRSILRSVAAVLLFAYGHVMANTPKNMTPGEIALLPEYCNYTQGFPLSGGGYRGAESEAQRPWLARLGDTFWALHHYCWAQLNVNRANRAGVPPAVRAHLYRTAIDDCHYVLENSTPDFPLRPEVLLRMGQYHERLGNLADALLNFQRSYAAKPDYWPAYLEIARINLRLGRRAAAAEAVDAGLKHAPDEPQLLKAREAIRRGP